MTLYLRSACAPDSRHTKPLQTVTTRVVPAIGSFYSARGIGSQASVGAAVDKEWRRAGKIIIARLAIAQSFLQKNGIELALCDFYLMTPVAGLFLGALVLKRFAKSKEFQNLPVSFTCNYLFRILKQF